MTDQRQMIIREVLKEYWCSKSYTLVKLAGDASTREYYRSCHDNSSVIVMDRHQSYQGADDSFIQLSHYLAERHLPVPQIISDRSSIGILLLEDFGDLTLEQAIANDSRKSIHTLYDQVINMLVTMHKNCTITSQDRNNLPWFSLRFDYEKLMWELDFFMKHFIQTHLNQTLSAHDDELLRHTFQTICYQLDQETPLVFTHRDFHARNIMIKAETVKLIDYQDARLGLPEYDLASLLRDAYVRLPENSIESYLADYYELTEDSRDISWRRAIFSFSCIQRNLKALGTFGFQASSKNNPTYLKYIPTLKHHLNSELDHLQHVVSANIPRIENLIGFRTLLNELLD